VHIAATVNATTGASRFTNHPSFDPDDGGWNMIATTPDHGTVRQDVIRRRLDDGSMAARVA